ncbi:ribbon-helix-helix domain-containing protein [Methylobacterium sp. ap11]|uniref:ribbon-helix-helix domain-containing protein n=1 Tax=Methylobacterium sp. ap11 TaxID=1761799 RepID=UPI000B885234|nr:ribbon-helix-helix domain-containing protein [Methylobacterium sp. ap11]
MDPDGPPPDRLPEGGLLKRSLVIAGHRTSVSLEAAFWEALRRLAAARGLSIQALVGRIDAERGEQNLSSAIRVFVLRAVWPGEGSVGPADIRREAQPVRG